MIRDANAAATVVVATPVANLWRQPVSGCQVSAAAAGGLAVDVTDGLIAYDGAHVPVAGVASLALSAADATQDRYDAIVVDSSGVVSVITGTAGQGYNPGSIDGTKVHLAVVRVAAGATTPTVVDDVRVNPERIPQVGVPQLEVAHSLPYTFLNTAQSGDPGAGKCGFDTTSIATASHLYVNIQPAIQFGSGYAGTWSTVKDWFNLSSLTPFYLRLWSRQYQNLFVLVKVTSITLHSTYADLGIESSFGQTSPDTGAAGTTPVLQTSTLDTIIEFAGVAAPSYPTASNGETTLAADTNITPINTPVDGPNTGSIGASGQKLLILATVTISQATAIAKVTARLWDGTTVFDETETSIAANAVGQLELKAVVSPSAAATYKVTCYSTVLTSTMKAQAPDNSVGGATKVASKILWARLA